jgi:hypothetical protein
MLKMRGLCLHSSERTVLWRTENFNEVVFFDNMKTVNGRRHRSFIDFDFNLFERCNIVISALWLRWTCIMYHKINIFCSVTFSSGAEKFETHLRIEFTVYSEHKQKFIFLFWLLYINISVIMLLICICSKQSHTLSENSMHTWHL